MLARIRRVEGLQHEHGLPTMDDQMEEKLKNRMESRVIDWFILLPISDVVKSRSSNQKGCKGLVTIYPISITHYSSFHVLFHSSRITPIQSL